MNANKNTTSKEEDKKSKVKIGNLPPNRDAVTDLTVSEQKQVKGGTARKELQQKLREKQEEIAELQ